MNSSLNYEKLKQLQQSGEWPTFQSELLQTKYADRYTQASRLFNRINKDTFIDLSNIVSNPEIKITEWHDQDLPEKIYSHKHEGPVIGWDKDYMIGPHDWEHEDNKIGDYVIRQKCYLYDWTQEKIQEHVSNGGNFDLAELEYFAEMHTDFKPILENYAKELYSDQTDISRFLHKLMVIEYSTPTANEYNETEHRKHNTDRFGPEHCDETLAGLHLGENYQEFQAQNTLTGEWEYIPGLTGSGMLWMFGEHAERSGWKPTFHRMIHNPDPWLGTRYSIIFDLQARFNGE